MENTGETAIVQDAVAETRGRIQALVDSGVQQAAIAREAGISASAINAWLRGRYSGDNDEIGRKLDRWSDSRAARLRAEALIPEIGFLPTPTSRKIRAALGYAQRTGRMAEIYGAPGVGKTTTIRDYATTNPNVWVATMAPDCAAPAMALAEVSDAIGLNPENGRAARTLREAIRRHVRGTKGLLVIDEAQHLAARAVEEMRALHDASGIGLVLAGSHALHGRIGAASAIATTAQLVSRMGMRVRVVEADAGDAQVMLDAWGVQGETERRMLAELVARPGALRNVAMTLEMAALAGNVNGKVNAAAIREARRLLEGAE